MRSFRRPAAETERSELLQNPRKKPKSKPNGVGLILRGRRRERMRSFRRFAAETKRSELLLTK